MPGRLVKDFMIHDTMKFDLLTTVDQGGCSAKLNASDLDEALAGLPKMSNENILVDIDTHDDGGVYKINDDYALIQTTDFFPPVCSDAYDFGQIAAANALSDVYAMGGQVLSALNLVLFPTAIPLSVLKEILLGGHDKMKEAGGVILGGHTIADDIPKYGLAVTGAVHPEKIITNSGAQVGDVLLLTKPLGTGIIISAQKNGLAPKQSYDEAMFNMKQLNAEGARVMQTYGVRSATDITGFGLLGHALKMAEGSGVCIQIDSTAVPAMHHVMELIEMGCIPGAAFRNQEFSANRVTFDKNVSYNQKMLLLDAQTSGGLLMCVRPEYSEDAIRDLRHAGYGSATYIGKVIEKQKEAISVI